MKLVIHNVAGRGSNIRVEGDAVIIDVPNPTDNGSTLAVSLRTETDEFQIEDYGVPHQSLAYREVYVGPKGGMTFRT